jgi:ribosome-binding factor A
MRRTSHRPERVSELIREEVAAFLTSQARDPRIGFVTVTRVDVSGDLGHARVFVSVMGTDEEKTRSLEGLDSAARFLRGQLAKVLRLRVAPEIRFLLDRGLEHSQRIERVLGELKRGADEGERGDPGASGDPAGGTGS